MARYIDADKLKESFSTDTQHIRDWDVDLFDLLIIEIDEAPTADVVKISCKCFRCECFELMTANNQHFCNKFGGYVTADDYCSRGELLKGGAE